MDLTNEVRNERAEELKATLLAISGKMVTPLFFLFWLCDLLYCPNQKWQFLGLRCLVIPTNVALSFLLKRPKTYHGLQRLAVAYSFAVAMPLAVMIFISGEWSSPYYAGLNLVALGALTFIPFTEVYFGITVFVIYLPYYLLFTVMPVNSIELTKVLVSTFFVIGTIVISAIIRFFGNDLKKKEVASRIGLKLEIQNRDKVIEEKSAAAIKLAVLSNQFSPQIVDAIRDGKINISTGVHRSKICAVFVDIVNSTDRVARGDKDKIDAAITMFMEDTIKTLLKYDITIDKFLGDGVLAFSNDPVPYNDYVERVVQAAIEIREKIAARQDQYIRVWMNELQLRFGIAVGFANVGFYGNDRYYKSYTAIGPVINLASRLCASAQPNEIVVSGDVAESLDSERFVVYPLGKKTLKGFESDIIHTFAVGSAVESSSAHDNIDCRICQNGLMYLDSDERGIFVMKCRSCGHIDTGTSENSPPVKNVA